MGQLADYAAVARRHLATGIIGLSALGAGAIVVHEGMVNTAYVDPVGVVTICAGHTKTAKLGQVKTDAECTELLQQDTYEAQETVQKLVKVRLTQEQFDALVSFTFNLGPTQFARSTLLKKINLGECWAAGAEFTRWDLAGGKRLRGLTIRRAYERAQFETGCRKPSTLEAGAGERSQHADRPAVDLPAGGRAADTRDIRRDVVVSHFWQRAYWVRLYDGVKRW